VTGPDAQARLYGEVAQEACAVVIRKYSSSFTLATRLLEKPVRRHVENIYALVRIADEIVDGASAGCGNGPEATRDCLDGLERTSSSTRSPRRRGTWGSARS
jgi:phytoene synthase